MNDLETLIAQINSLENGNGLQYLLNEGAKLFGNPSMLFNMEYELIAATENVETDDFLWNEINNNGRFSDERIAFFNSEEFSDAAAGTKSVVLLTSENMAYDRYYGRIFNSDNSTVADLILLGCNKPFENGTIAAVEAFSKKLTAEVCMTEFYRQYAILYHQSLMRQLLDKNYSDRALYSDHVANLYEGFDASLYLAVADVSKGSANPDEYRDMFKRAQPDCKFGVYGEYVLILISSDDPTLDADKSIGGLTDLFARDNICAGVSRRFDNLFEMRKHFEQAVAALKSGGDRRFSIYTEAC